jgi:hypothetical protein
MGKFLGQAGDVFKYEDFSKEFTMVVEEKSRGSKKCSPIILKNLYLILINVV